MAEGIYGSTLSGPNLASNTGYNGYRRYPPPEDHPRYGDHQPHNRVQLQDGVNSQQGVSGIPGQSKPMRPGDPAQPREVNGFQEGPGADDEWMNFQGGGGSCQCGGG